MGGLLLSALMSCTSARWTVKEKAAIDKSDYEVLEEDNFLMASGEVSPQNPILKLEVFSRTKYEYTQRVLMQRNIQKYKLRPGFVALGLGGAAMAFYLANSHFTEGISTSTKSLTLNGIGVLMAASGFLNMEAVGEPRPTGEERYLRTTGSTVKIDTVKADQNVGGTVSVDIRYNERIILEEERNISGGSAEIGLAGRLNDLQLTGTDPGDVSVEVVFEDSVYSYNYPVEDILLPFAEVAVPFTELRNHPDDSADNILADLARGSQLQIQSSENEDWFRVLYGISENYIKKDDAELIWRSTDFVQEDQIVTIPRIPFGNIDVESNIPILRGSEPNAVALILTNENYAGDLEKRSHAHRDGQLIRTYLTSALGYAEQNIYQLKDISDPDKLFNTLSDIKSAANDSTELFVYLSGYGAVDTQGEQPLLKFLGISSGENGRPQLFLNEIFDHISTIPSDKTLVLADIDFSLSVKRNQFSKSKSRRIIEANAAALRRNPQASLLMGTHLVYPSSLYYSADGEDKKHHIFPYFFAKALQERRTNLSGIYQYLERNISYTARRLFDRPQDPLLFGNTSMNLAE